MNQKTDASPGNQISRRFLTVLSVLTILVLAVTIGIDHSVSPASHSRRMTLAVSRGGILFPCIIAAAQTIENGLAVFGGKQPEIVPPPVQAAAIAGLSLTFVIFPTVFLFRWRERRLREDLRNHARPLSLSDLIYGFCEVTTIFFAVAIVPINFLHQSLYSSLRTRQAIQMNKDIIVDGIVQISVNLRQYRILPKSVGGGGGSCSDYVLPDQLKKTPDATFSVQVVNDTAIVRAQSLEYPDAKAIVRMPCRDFDSEKKYPKWMWEYEGDFL